MLFYEQKTFSSFQKITKTQWKIIMKCEKLTNWKARHRNHHQYQKKKNMSSNWQHIRYQLYELTIMMKFKDKKERTKTITNCEKHKTKQNNKNHERNRKDKHEYHQSSRINSVQWNENVRTQDYARNELITTAQFKNWLKTKKSHDEKLQMQNQTNSNEVMNRD